METKTYQKSVTNRSKILEGKNDATEPLRGRFRDPKMKLNWHPTSLENLMIFVPNFKHILGAPLPVNPQEQDFTWIAPPRLPPLWLRYSNSQAL